MTGATVSRAFFVRRTLRRYAIRWMAGQPVRESGRPEIERINLEQEPWNPARFVVPQ